MDLENSTMKTFKIIIRDLVSSIETYVIEANCSAAAIKTAKKLWDESHPGHHPVNYAWNEIVETKPQAPVVAQPQPKSNLRKAFAPATVITHRDSVKAQPAKEETHSGIYTTVNGQPIELSLVPKSEY